MVSAGEGAMSLQEYVPFNISVRGGYGADVLGINGEVDMSEVEAFRACVAGIITSGDGVVVVDLADVTFIDTTAISALLIARRCLAGEGRELLLQHVTAPIARVFELAGLTDLLADTRDALSQPS